MIRHHLPLLGLLASAAAQDAAALASTLVHLPLDATALLRPLADEPMHGTIGNDFTSAYFFRGILQENQGAIAEPYVDLDMALHEGAGELRGIDLHFGQWNSLHDGPSGTAGPQSMWYENDLYLGLEVTGARGWSVAATYTVYYSPNGRFRTVQELAFALGFDDADLLAPGFAGLQPRLLVAFETSGRADGEGSRGVYGELSVAPTFDLGAIGTMPVQLELPCKLGLSLGDYYESALTGESTFGYLDLGAVLHAPLSFLPARLGSWEGTFGVHALALGRSNEELAHGSNFELVITGGFSTTF